MKNFIFVSPHFPENYRNFCIQLHANGVSVLGIGDAPYDSLDHSLQEALTEYYYVGSMESYEEMYRAVAFFCFKYGKIDGLESNNEYWLEQDARLREDFNIPGLRPGELGSIKCKSGMKKYYAEAGVPCARYHLVTDLEESLAFIREVGYPVIVKPDNGVGASDTSRISSEEELRRFHEKEHGDTVYIMEEFIRGDIYSYDAIIDSEGRPLLETGNHTMTSIMDIVNNQESCVFYIEKQIKKDLREAGRRCVAAFGIRSRFIHFEFFRLTQDHAWLGKKGTVVALEANLRPSGGFTPDMINYACSTDVYRDWADMVAFDRLRPDAGEESEQAQEAAGCPKAAEKTAAGREEPAAGREEPAAGREEPAAGREEPAAGREEPAAGKEKTTAGRDKSTAGKEKKYYCVSVGLRDSRRYVHGQEEIREKYADRIVLEQRLPAVLAHAMGDTLYLARFAAKKEMDGFIRFLTQESSPRRADV